MSIASTVRTAGPFAGTGSLVALPFAFKVFAASDLVVQRTNVAGDVATLTLTTHYSVSLNADQDTSPGGTVTLVTALAVGETAALTSNVSATQPLQLASGGPFLPGQIEDALDRAMIVVQQQGVLGEQTLRVPLGETALILPSAEQRANKALLFDADGDPYLDAPASGSAADLALSIASTASGKGAALVGVQDTADNFVGTHVEAVLAEIALRAYSVELERYRHLNALVGAEERWDNAFSAALTEALSSKKPIYLGCSPIVKYFTNTWDLSANDTTKDGLQIFGAGIRKSKPYFRNTSGACLEVQGTDRLHLRDFQVSGDCPVGIAGGRATVRQWCGRHYYENLAVVMPDNMAANGGMGSIGLLGIEPEESTYHCCEFWANIPVIICPPNQINVKTFTTAGVLTTARSMTWTPTYTPIIGTLLSNTIFHFTGGCRMVAYQPDSPPIVLRSASGVDLGGSFLQIRGGGLNPAKDVKKCPYAIDASNVWNLQWFGTGERGVDDPLTDVGAVLIDGSAENWTISANAGTANSATLNLVPVIYIVDAIGGLHRNCDLKFRLNSHQGQYPFGFSNSTGSSIKLENCTYRISTTASLSTIPQPLLYNMSGSKISLSPLNATTPVVLEKPLRYKSILQAAKDLPHTVATTVATCVLPPSGMSSGTIQFRNVVLNAGYLNIGPQVALITGEFDVSWTRTAATSGLAATVTRSSFSSSVKTLAGSLDIAAPTITTLLSGQASFQVQVIANLSGTSATGTATWFSADVICSASLGISASTATITTQ